MKTVIRIRALDRFRRYYYHALRNGKPTGTAADEAMTRMKAEVLAWLEEDKTLDEWTKRELWGDVFAHVLDWQMLLTDVTPTASPELLGKKIEGLDAKEAAERMKDAGDNGGNGAGSGNT